MGYFLLFTTKIKSFTTNFTTKKHRKQENSLEFLGNNKLLKPCVYKDIMLIYGIIWNRMEW